MRSASSSSTSKPTTTSRVGVGSTSTTSTVPPSTETSWRPGSSSVTAPSNSPVPLAAVVAAEQREQAEHDDERADGGQDDRQLAGLAAGDVGGQRRVDGRLAAGAVVGAAVVARGR